MAVFIDQKQSVVVTAESGRAEVANDERHLLAQSLCLGVLQQVLRFGGKSNAIRRVRQGGNGGQHIGVLSEQELRRCATPVLLDFLVCRIGRPPVGHSRRGDEGIVLRCQGQHSRQ